MTRQHVSMWSRLLIFAPMAFAACASGCIKSYEAVPLDVGRLERFMSSAAPSDAAGKPLPFMEMPRLKARFCLQRAIENYKSSWVSTGFDMGMLVTAGVAGGIGSSVGAVSAAMDDANGSKRSLGIASVGLLAGAGAMLGLRAALNLSEVGRAQRIAAANAVNAAITLLEKYAMVDDPATVGDDGFGTCRDGDVNVANALPGVNSNQALEQTVLKAKEVEKKADADATETKIAASDAKKKAKADRAKAEDLRKKVQTLQAPLPPGPNAAAADADRKTALEQAKKDLAQAESDETKSKIQELNAVIDAAKADILVAQAELATKRAGVLAAGGMLRRAVFYLTAKDVETATTNLDAALIEVQAVRQRIQALQERLEKLLLKTSEEYDVNQEKPQ